MGFSAVFLVPFALLLPAVGTLDPPREPAGAPAAVEAGHMQAEAQTPAAHYALPRASAGPAAKFPRTQPFRTAAQSFRIPDAYQVRIEQRLTIRIIPRPAPMQPDMLMNLPDQDIGSHFAERNIGKCLPASAIAAVQPDGGRRLILFMRDHRIISAELERTCRARDFYSGFYLAHSPDGKLCVNRDSLLSRSGVNCKLTRIRQLIETGN